MSRIAITSIALAMVCTISLPAQLVSGGATVNPSPLGSVVSLSIEAVSPAVLNSGCGFDAVHQGSPTGPVVYTPFICPFLLIIVGPGGPYNNAGWPGTDNSGNAVAPGTYWIEIGHRDAITNAVQPPTFIPVRIDDPATTPAPILTATTSTRGALTNFTISSPMNGGASYFLAASLTTNVGIPLGNPAGDHVALDMDVLFNLSFFTPFPPLFNNFQGTLDAMGMTSAPSFDMPNFASLQGQNVAWQALIIGGNGLEITNPITQAIQ